LRSSARSGFTLLELLTVCVIIAVLAALGVGLFDQLRDRSERVNCTNNLRGLYSGFQSYVVQHGHWPQNPNKIADKGYDNWWIEEMQKLGISEKAWICPTHQREQKKAAKLSPQGKEKRDPNKKEDRQIHYLPTPFDHNPATPRRWPTQPWLIEVGNFHGDGPLIIFPDGTVNSLGQFLRQGR
jgi:prepilin-type N-terminal cleavage/methylation domain-containing protein